LVAANARYDRALEIFRHIAHALELIGKSLVLAELIFDLLQPRLDLLDDHADVRALRHLAPLLELRGIVVDRLRDLDAE
jgi:hypothetical protein